MITWKRNTPKIGAKPTSRQKEASTPSWKSENHEHDGAVSEEEITELKELYNTNKKHS
jgi:hypothetical protein